MFFFQYFCWFNHQPGKCWEFCGSFGFAVLWLKDGLGLLLCQPEVASACRTTPKKHGKCPSETAHVSSAWCSRLHPRDSCWRCRWRNQSNAVNSSGGPGQCHACRSDWLPLLPAQAQGHDQSPWAHDWDELTPKKVICFARSLVVSTPFSEKHYTRYLKKSQIHNKAGWWHLPHKFILNNSSCQEVNLDCFVLHIPGLSHL